MIRPAIHAVAAGLLLSTTLAATAGPTSSGLTEGIDWIFADRFEQPPPNILLVIMDDVGIDQMSSFGYGGQIAPAMPSIDAIAEGGLRFRNTWSMPECSPGRSVVFTGRYPLRNNVLQALGPNDLANSQISEFEMTLPKLLKHAGYQSAMFGKFHLAGPEHNAAGQSAPSELGWDYFEGWTGGLPDSIDTTAGGVGTPGTYSCGFVPDTASDPVHGADSGACYLPEANGDIGCVELSGNNAHGDSPGLQCLTDGGILVPEASCQSEAPTHLTWELGNAHYVSPLVINHDGQVDEADLIEPRARGYRSTLEINAAIDWIQQQSGSGKPWMATVSFSAPHTPLHHPPAELLPSGVAADLTADCGNLLNQRRITDAMIEALDTELGRLMIETGLAEADGGGGLDFSAVDSNTLIVIYGDNGSFGPTAKLPFDPTRAKGSAYQTGIWVPLVVAGPMVESADRDIEHMVNGVDVFSLFGEVAGLDVPALVPRPIDSVPMLPYLENPSQYSLRQYNFAQGGLNIQIDGGRNGPCVVATACSHTPVSKSVCEDNGGIWWGIGADDPAVIQGDLEQCWEVNQAIYHDDPENYQANRFFMAWTVYQTIRNEHFKLIRNQALDYDPTTDGPIDVSVEELYHINQAQPLPLLDLASSDLLADGELGPIPAANHAQLSQALDALLASQVDCPGDGNDDGKVDQLDIDNYHAITAEWSGSSTYDFNYDGQTDAADLQIIMSHLGTVCGSSGP